jgi:hypothetical protein
MGEQKFKPQPAMFRTRLVTSCVANGWWLTESPFVVESKVAGIIEIPAGFMFNGNSVPRLSWIISPPSDWLEAGALHDYLYHYGNDKELADKVYKEVLEALGMGKLRRNFRYFGLKLFGGIGFKRAQATRKTV